MSRQKKLNETENSIQQNRQKIRKNIDLQAVNYDILSKPDLIKQLKSRDKMINDINQSLATVTKSDADKIRMYRKKLQQQIAHNEKAVKAFQTITQTVVQIINKYQFIDQQTRQTIANTVNVLRQTKGVVHKQQQQSQINSSEEQNSEFNCVDEIVEETSKLLQYLSKLTDQNVSIIKQMKFQIAQFRSQPKGNTDQSMLILQQQINEKTLQVKNLQKLLLQNQQQKNKLLASIHTSITEQKIQQLKKLEVLELIEEYKLLSYRVNQLESDKKSIFIKLKSDKQESQKKLKNLLSQVKDMKIQKKNNSMSLS